MKIAGWEYYNNAAIPTEPICFEPDIILIENGDIWNMDGSPLLARWTTDFDCKYETNWWYVIKDNSFDISRLKANYRYKINKGIRMFECKRINPKEYLEELHEVFLAAYSSWPKKYRPNASFERTKKFINEICNQSSTICYGAFFRESGKLCGFMKCRVRDVYTELQIQRVNPAYEKYQINAALVHCLINDFSFQLCKGETFILDGARSINHETAFQDYLEKYFGFRKVYCKLHIAYNPKIKWAVDILFKFRKMLIKLDGIGIIHKINGILKMEEIIRGNI